MAQVSEATAKMLAFEHGAGYETAMAIIDSTCRWADEHRLDCYDISTAEGIDVAAVQESVAYLEWRGLIERDEENSNIVTILDEGEPLPGNAAEQERA